jgi:1-acyl-sn-glycerol-3-phosphate acyltransferase
VRSAARRAAAYFTVGSYTLLAPFGCAVVTALVFLWRGDALVCARRTQRLIAAAYRFMHDWLDLVRITDFDYRRVRVPWPAGPCVIVSNHPTLMDTTSITAVFGGGFTIVKREMHSRALLRPFMEGAGHVAAAGDDPLSTQRVVDDCVRWIERGFSAIVFPEGTRSPPGRLRPFGRTAFEIACRARVPVVCLTIVCEPVYLSKEVTVLRPPDPTPRFELAWLAQVEPADHVYDSRALRRAVEDRYVEWHRGRALAAAPDSA